MQRDPPRPARRTAVAIAAAGAAALLRRALADPDPRRRAAAERVCRGLDLTPAALEAPRRQEERP
ncbi:MAG: hypothetical protein HY721_12965 [Planctomycetes bacterium]|nr:hypothetical protein [Planctomycetota bacterium]